MSKIALSGNASGTGTLTIAAPNTNTDRTLTLPDAAGTVNVSGLANEVPAGSAGAPAIYPTGDSNTGVFFPAADTVAVATGGSERLRVDSSGNLLVGTTTAIGRLTVNGNGPSNYAATLENTTSGNNVLGVFGSASGGTQNFVVFAQSAGSVRGTISTNGTTTSYNTSSDYRLKENVQPMQDALAKIAQLNPVTYTWKVDGSDGQGFIAHELQAVVPDCVTGEKDAVDEDGNPKYQGVDTSFLVATLVKAVQELTARIAVLEAN
jgi:hypothetical protein